MGKKRPDGFDDVVGLPGNVLRLEPFRRLRSRLTRAATASPEEHTIFYLSDSARWLDLLTSFPYLTIEPIHSEPELKGKLLAQAPDLILLESKLQWECPISVIEKMRYVHDVPVVMICGANDLRKKPNLLKQAFSVGLHDTLSTPLKRDELWESLEVLLKFRRQLSLTP